MEINSTTYIITLYPLLFLSIASILSVIRNLKRTSISSLIPSFQAFEAYFICGVVGWSLLGVFELSGKKMDLELGIFFFLTCSFLLLLVSTDTPFRSKRFYAFGFIHLVVFVLTFLATTDYMKLIVFDMYILTAYTVIFLSFLKKYKSEKNIGYLNMIFSVGLVIAVTPALFFELIFQHNSDLNIQALFTVGAIGYTLVGIGFVTMALIKEQQLLSEMALKDPLTGALNRRGLSESLEKISLEDSNYRIGLSVLAIDIDHFKSINDEYGHDAGDEALTMVAQTIQSSIRETDFFCRVGGEEFLVVMPMTSLEEANNIAERIRVKIEKKPIFYHEQSIRLTSSFGLTNQKLNSDIKDIIKKADTALFEAKKAGRNRVCIKN